MNRLDSGKALMILGGTSGLGWNLLRQIAVRPEYSRYYEAVIVVGRSAVASGKETTFRINNLPIHYMDCDLADGYSVVRLKDQLVKARLQVRLLINCAAVNQIVPTLETSVTVMQDILNLNTFGIVRIFQEFLAADDGFDGFSADASVVNIGSNASDGAGADSLAYVASKHALTGVTRSLARDFPQVATMQVNLPFLVGTRMTDYIVDRQSEAQAVAPGRYLEAQNSKAPAGKVMHSAEAASLLTGLLSTYPETLQHLRGSIIKIGYPS